MADHGDYDQAPEDNDLDAATGEVYTAGAVGALRAVLTALDERATIERLREFCEAALEKFTQTPTRGAEEDDL